MKRVVVAIALVWMMAGGVAYAAAPLVLPDGTVALYCEGETVTVQGVEVATPCVVPAAGAAIGGREVSVLVTRSVLPTVVAEGRVAVTEYPGSVVVPGALGVIVGAVLGYVVVEAYRGR